TAAVRAELARAAVRTAVRFAAGQPVAAGVAALADGFLKALARARLNLTLGLASALGTTVAAVGLFWFSLRGAGPASRPPSDHDKLQGGWQVLAIDKAGRPREDNPGLQFVFAGDQVTWFAEGGAAPPMHFVLDPSREPKAVDFTTQTGQIFRGIYRVDGN